MTSKPAAVRVAFVLWLGALAAGLAEMLLRSSQTTLSGAGIRLGIYAVLAVVMLQMRAGRNWARWTLAVLLGVVGTLSLVIEPIGALVAGNPIGNVTLTGGLAAASRGVHLICVLVAVPLMFLPSANAFFRGAAGWTAVRATPGAAVPCPHPRAYLRSR